MVLEWRLQVLLLYSFVKLIQKHDNCYATCGKTKQQCDLDFFYEFPLYGAAVIQGCNECINE